MSSAWIRVRPVKVSKRHPRGRSFQVLYRRGGGGWPIQAAGSFKTEREARIRRDLVGGWLAAGLDPKAELKRLLVEPAVVRDYSEWAGAYRDSRIDIDETTRANMRSHLLRLDEIFGDRDPHSLTVADQIEAVAKLAAALAPSSVSRYWATHRLILDFAGVTPNPARDPAVKLPQVIEQEIVPPTAAQFLAILDKTPRSRRLPLVVLEQTAMAVGEAHTLTWGDVDVSGCQFRLRRANVKAQLRARARWVQVPEWLMALIEDTCPLDDRAPDRRVFPGFTPDVAKNVMARACLAAGVPHYSPHELRHRRLSLWHGQGVPAKELAARAGHSKASMTLDVYSHVMALDEAPKDSLEALLVMPR